MEIHFFLFFKKKMNFHVFFLGRTPGGARAAKLPCAELASDGSL
jgi:hypothetical protein